jgi:micrococcal nuclease
MKRIISFFLLTVISLGLVACQQPSEKHEHEFVNGKCECGELHDCKYYKGQCTCGKLEPSSGPVDENNIPTPYTDSLKLTANYVGKNFSNDGIGEVKLANSTDGDTAIFKDNNRNITVRFNGVNTPESTYKLEPWGVAASKFTKGKLEKASFNSLFIILLFLHY